MLTENFFIGKERMNGNIFEYFSKGIEIFPIFWELCLNCLKFAMPKFALNIKIA